MKILLHTCCSTCTIGPYQCLVEAGHTVTGLFYNPNIHPLMEFRRRKKSQKTLQERLPIPMLYEEEYGLREFLASVNHQTEERCADCYRMRLSRTARRAGELGCDAFTTTLLTSGHQGHELVRRTGEECASAHGVPFHYEDWRPLRRANREKAGQWRLYLQQYCGCIFSEYERFKDTARHVYRGSGPACKG